MLNASCAPEVAVWNELAALTWPLVSHTVHAACDGAGRFTFGTSPAYIGYWPAAATPGATAAVASAAATATSAPRTRRCFEFMWRCPLNTSEVGGRPLR